MNNINFLVELGFEEIPSSYLEPGIKMLSDNLSKVFKKYDVEYENMEYYFTPRRYIVHIKGIKEDNTVKNIEITGPPKNIAKRDDSWTKAALGFAKSQGKSVDDIYFVVKGKNEVCALKVEKRRKGVEEILRENLVKSIESVRFPKMMIWDESRFRFARPIRWLLVLKDASAVRGIEFAGIQSGNFTYGNRMYGNIKIEINSISEYFTTLEENHVIYDQYKRKKIITDGMLHVGKKDGFSVLNDNELLDEINGMVEFPVVLAGTFHNQYTELPEKVVATAMKQHQRYFSCHYDNGKIAPYFVFVANTDKNNPEIVTNNEKVLKSRLEDAYFYYEEDLKIPISERIEMQKDILWQHDLGTIYEKALRVAKISAYLSELLDINIDRDKIEEIALHLKIDLSTNMIKDGKEFTKLEGYIGKVYAEKLGVDNEIANIIMEHNLPRFAKDKLPETEKGALFALGDRYDTVTGFVLRFGIPKGSKDPLGIRRLANAIIEITADREWHYDFMSVISKAADGFSESSDSNEVYDFFIDRIINYAQNENIRYDIINAIAALRLNDIYDIVLRSRILHSYRELSGEEFKALVIGQKRVANILKKTDVPGEVNPELFKDEQERVLYDACLELGKSVEALLSKRDYATILNEYFRIRPIIDNFFDEVLVMAEDRSLRTNRLALLGFLRDLFLKLADFSQIVLEGER